jgi:hypothetical protein
MADNADGVRIACQLKVAAAPRPGTPRYWAYVILHWAPTKRAADLCPHWGTTLRYPSSEVPLLEAARWISNRFGYPGVDLRTLGLLGVISVGILVGLICWIAPGPRWLRVLMAALVALVIADAAFAPYFISMYSAPAGLLGILALCAAWLWAPKNPWLRVLSLVPITLAAIVVGCDETQLAPAVFVIGALLIWRRTNISSRPGRFGAKAAALACVAVLVLVFIVYNDHQSKVGNDAIHYDAVFVSLLSHTQDKAADLKWLGLNPALAKYAGVEYWEPGSAYYDHDPLLKSDFVPHFSYVRLAEFYALHPTQAWGLFERSAADASLLRPIPIGNYADNSGLAQRAHPCRLCTVSNVVPATQSLAWLVLPLWWLFTLRSGFVLARRRRHEVRWRALGETMVVLTLFAIASFGAVMLGEGDLDSTRHDVFASLATALLVPLAVAAIWGLMDTRRDAEGKWQPGRRLRRLIDFMVAPPVHNPHDPGGPPSDPVSPRPSEPVGAPATRRVADRGGRGALPESGFP